jgi:hypothetical protein
MGRKLETVAQPLLQRFMPENDRLQARTTSTGLQMKSKFGVKGLHKKHSLLSGSGVLKSCLFFSTAR